MKQLEDKIKDILTDNQHCSPIAGVVGEDLASTEIAKEVKGIAIEFSNYKESYKPVANGQPDFYQHPTLRRVLTIDEIFDAFLKDKYKK